MAKATLVLTDDPTDGGVFVEVVFDPPLPGGYLKTEAQLAAARIYKQICEADDEAPSGEVH